MGNLQCCRGPHCQGFLSLPMRNGRNIIITLFTACNSCIQHFNYPVTVIHHAIFTCEKCSCIIRSGFACTIRVRRLITVIRQLSAVFRRIQPGFQLLFFQRIDSTLCISRHSPPHGSRLEVKRTINLIRSFSARQPRRHFRIFFPCPVTIGIRFACRIKHILIVNNKPGTGFVGQ